jgi:transposase-like protein
MDSEISDLKIRFDVWRNTRDHSSVRVPDDLRALAVRLANKASFAKLAKEIGVSAVSLYTWRKEVLSKPTALPRYSKIILPEENQSPLEPIQAKQNRQNVLASASFGAVRIDFFEEAVLARIVNLFAAGAQS